MKKIVSLLFLITSPILVFSQTIIWDFNTSNDGWTSSNFTETTGTTALQLTTNGINPNITITNADVKTTFYYAAAITLKVSGNGPTLIRFGYAKDATPTDFTYVNRPIANNTSEFITYYVYLPDWKGTINNISLQLKTNDGSPTGADYNTNGAIIEIDKIEIFDDLEVRKDIFDFNLDYDQDEWLPENCTLQGPTRGTLTLVPQTNVVSSLYTSGAYYVIRSGIRKYLNIILKNESTDLDEIRISAGFNSEFVSQTISTSDTTFKTYSIDVSSLSEWKGLVISIEINFINNITEKSSNTGNILIDDISFSRESLGIDEFDKNSITLYPNPVKDILNFNSKISISSVEIYDMSGKLLLNHNGGTTFDVNHLNSGIYIIKVLRENTFTTMRFVKN